MAIFARDTTSSNPRRRIVADLDWRTYWFFQAAFWSAVYIWRTVFTLASGYGFRGADLRLISVAFAIGVTVVLSRFIAKFVGTPIRVWQFCVIALITLSTGFAHTVLDRIMYNTARNGWEFSFPPRDEFQTILSVNLWVFASWTGFFLVILLMKRAERQRLAVERLHKLANETKLALLTSQLKPHFLLNTLNAVSALIHEGRYGEADVMLIRLGRFLRRVLQVQHGQRTTVAEEVALLGDYLEIQKVRLGDRLSYAFDVPTDCKDQKTTALILQPIVENAVKHAIAQRVEGGQITIMARRSEGALTMSVTDDGDGFDASAARDGIGLSIVKERLDAHYGDDAAFEIGPGIKGGTRVEMRLPAIDDTAVLVGMP